MIQLILTSKINIELSEINRLLYIEYKIKGKNIYVKNRKNKLNFYSIFFS